MHLTRPTSSKGRSRPPADHTMRDTGDVQDQDQTPAAVRKSDGSLRSRSNSVTRHATHPGPGDAAQSLQFAPAARSPLSLNKYKVLPSIKKQSGVSHANDLELKTSKIKLCDHVVAQQRRHSHGEPGCSTAKTRTATRSNPEMGNVADVSGRVAPVQPPDPDPNITGTKDETAPVAATDRLLLAVRAPCGRRFQQHFAYTDTLQTLVACAEARYETSYAEAFIETMDVPRRSFRRLDMTLSECSIFNRSVLCISLESYSGKTPSVVDNG